MTNPAPCVFVVDDDESIRKALGRLLRSARLRAETFGSAEEFLIYLRPDAPGCLLLDVQLPGLDGLELQRELEAAHVELPIVFMTGHGDIPMSVQAMKAGAADFLAKPFDDETLLRAVRQAIATNVQARLRDAAVSALRLRAESLSPREREVLTLVVSGLMNKHIGRRLGVTEKTIKVHRGQVMHKMHSRSLPDLVRMAATIGIQPVAD
jgi:FixJ family two-component response regulator